MQIKIEKQLKFQIYSRNHFQQLKNIRVFKGSLEHLNQKGNTQKICTNLLEICDELQENIKPDFLKILYLLLFFIISLLLIKFNSTSSKNMTPETQKIESSNQESNSTKNLTQSKSKSKSKSQSYSNQTNIQKLAYLITKCTNQSCKASILFQSESDFFKFISEANSKSIFYFNSNDHLNLFLLKEKEFEIFSNLTSMFQNFQNSFLLSISFIKPEQSASFLKEDFKQANVFYYINQLFIKEKQKYKFQHIYKIRLSLDEFNWNIKLAKKFDYIRQSEIDLLIDHEEKLMEIEWYLQESIALLAYSNIDQICKEIVQDQDLKSTCLRNEECFSICEKFEKTLKK